MLLAPWSCFSYAINECRCSILSWLCNSFSASWTLVSNYLIVDYNPYIYLYWSPIVSCAAWYLSASSFICEIWWSSASNWDWIWVSSVDLSESYWFKEVIWVSYCYTTNPISLCLCSCINLSCLSIFSSISLFSSSMYLSFLSLSCPYDSDSWNFFLISSLSKVTASS